MAATMIPPTKTEEISSEEEYDLDSQEARQEMTHQSKETGSPSPDSDWD